MEYKDYSNGERDRYKSLLQLLGGLSKLFSDSSTPYLYYRSAENVFCESFRATNLARSDVSVDAIKNKTGIGLKTFLIGNKKTFQKVAEFNAGLEEYTNLQSKDKVIAIAKLRNARIDFTKRLYSLDTLIYHCVVRSEGKFHIYESKFDSINIAKIKLGKVSKKSIHFSDDLNEYSFNLSKSTLLKRFNTNSFMDEFPVEIVDTVLHELENAFTTSINTIHAIGDESIVLPLYSPSGRSFEKSGLNQWNAEGRERNKDEIYIPIPAWIHKKFPEFFPEKGEAFDLQLPNGKEISVKVCQSGGKALMSNPNSALGKWLLRDILNLEDGELVTSQLLEIIGIDSVSLHKTSSGKYEIHFKETSSYENFEKNNS